MKQILNPANPLAMLLLAAATAFAQASASEQSFTDSRDGKTYKAVKIGEQVWMAENLNYNAKGSKCYDNSESNCKKYGRLYDWKTAKTACPSGWHLPSRDEWNVLSNSVGGSDTEEKHLKATSGWDRRNGLDTYGFAALPGGSGSSDGNFAWAKSVAKFGSWWNSSEDDSYMAHSIELRDGWEFSFSHSKDKRALLSIRCVVDRYLFEQNFTENDISVAYSNDDLEISYVPNIGFSVGKRVIYNGSVKLLDRSIPETALAVLDKKELRILRNAIFAKHGLIFQSDDLKAYFPKFDWYKPQSKDVNKKLTDVDKKNIERIQAFENAKPNLKINKKDLVGFHNNEIHTDIESSQLDINDNNTIGYVLSGYDIEEDNFKGSYKIENGFLVVFVTEQNVSTRVNDTDYFLSKNWHWPNGVTFKEYKITYKDPIKMVFPVGDVIYHPVYSDRKGRQIGSVKWWVYVVDWVDKR
jgi:uncharacterized protein (TIGR02145 family)